MIGSPRALAVLLAAGLLLPRTASAQLYDPGHTWRTMETPHFQLHFHEGEEPLARRLAGAAERAHVLLVPALGHDPEGKTQLVLADDVDDANGSATPIPYNTIRVNAVPPESLSVLNDYRDWVYALVAHEYTHILHMDTVGGVPRAFDSVFGKLWAPNALLPSWFLEGMAVLHESGPGAGRNASPLFDMWARAVVMEGAGLFPLPEVSNQPLDWPLGNLWYLLGGRFIAFLQARYGDEALRAFIRDQGDQLWPYRLATLSERHFGRSFDRLWVEFGESLRELYRAQLDELRSRPVTPPRPLTHRGAFVQHPRWSPDGTVIAYFDQGLDERPGVRLVSPSGEDLGRIAAVYGNGTLAMRSSREALVAATDVFHEYRTYDDLYLVDLRTGGQRRLTYGERATDPDVSPDGASAVYVARIGDGELELRRLRLDGGQPETLLHRPGSQIFMPRISPDGRRIAFELQEGGRRNIAVLEGGALYRVTGEDAIDTGPSWSPDGRWLYFSSERSGVYDVYAWEPSGPVPADSPPAADGRPPLRPGVLRQVTNVESGAFEPQASPDGKTLLFVTYSRAGYDLATAPLDPATWLDPAPPLPRPSDPEERYDPAPDYAVHPYHVLDTVGPAGWLPIFGYDAAGATAGVLTAGMDVVGLHLWALETDYSLQARDVDYDLAYVGHWMFPQLTLTSSRVIGEAPGQPTQLETIWTPVNVGLAFPSTRIDQSFLLTVSWGLTSYRSREPNPAFQDGTASQLAVGAFFQNDLRFVRSISPETGGTAGITAWGGDPALGGDFRYAAAEAFGTRYLRVPGTRHVVLAARLSIGAATGSIGGSHPFSLGGVATPSLLDLLLGVVGPADQLRGYPSGIFVGDALVNGNLELRFPILAPQAGHSTWPVFLRRVHGALFLDTGMAWVPGQGSPTGVDLRQLDQLHYGAGAELRLEVVLGYDFVTDVRLGVARGLGQLFAPGHPSDPYAETQVYLTVGPSF